MSSRIKHEKNIFCIETEKENNYEKSSSSRYFLEQLKNFSEGEIKFIHRRCATIEELIYYTKKLSLKKYEKFSIVYMSAHGTENSFYIGNKRITLDKFGDLIGESLSGKLLHLGSCETLKIKKAQRTEFLDRTGIAAISGFKREVTYSESAALEFLLFDRIRDYKSIENLESRMIKSYPGLVSKTGFKIYYR